MEKSLRIGLLGNETEPLCRIVGIGGSGIGEIGDVRRSFGGCRRDLPCLLTKADTGRRVILLAVERRLGPLPAVEGLFNVPIELTGLMGPEPSSSVSEGRLSLYDSACEDTVESGRCGNIVDCSLTGLETDLCVDVAADTGVSSVLALRGRSNAVVTRLTGGTSVACKCSGNGLSAFAV